MHCCYKHYLNDFLFNQFIRLAHPSPNGWVILITECKSPQFSPPRYSHQAHFNSQHSFQHPSCCEHIHKDFQFHSGTLRRQIFKGKKPVLEVPLHTPRSHRRGPAPCRSPPSCSEKCHLHQVREELSSHLNQSQHGELGTQTRLFFPSMGRESKHQSALFAHVLPCSEEGLLFPREMLRALCHSEEGDNIETWPKNTQTGWGKPKTGWRNGLTKKS